jgi:hypothetical protein
MNDADFFDFMFFFLIFVFFMIATMPSGGSRNDK